MVLKTKKVKCFQLRQKKVNEKDLLKIAVKIKKITKKNKVKFLINDKPIVAKKINADGCHIGQNDTSYLDARKIVGKNKIIGIQGVDTRMLTRIIRNEGAMNAIISSEEVDQSKLLKKLKEIPSMDGLNLANRVTCDSSYHYSLQQPYEEPPD